MKTLITITSLLGLVLVIGPAILYLAGAIDKDPMQTLMLAGTVLWFVSVPFRMGRKN